MKVKHYSTNQVRSIFEEAKKNMKLAFAFPGTSWGIEFSNCWDVIQGLCRMNDFPYTVTRAYEPNIYTSRNKCLGGNPKKPKDQPIYAGNDVTHVLWMDYDTVAPPASFLTMLTNFEYDIIAGMVKTREDEGYAVYTIDNYDEKEQRFVPWKGEPDPEDGYPFQVEFTGLAFTMVKKTVFDAIGYPWFFPIEGLVRTGPGKEDFNKDFNSEDAGLCIMAKQYGFRVWADPRIHCGHIKQRMLT